MFYFLLSPLNNGEEMMQCSFYLFITVLELTKKIITTNHSANIGKNSDLWTIIFAVSLPVPRVYLLFNLHG